MLLEANGIIMLVRQEGRNGHSSYHKVVLVFFFSRQGFFINTVAFIPIHYCGVIRFRGG